MLGAALITLHTWTPLLGLMMRLLPACMLRHNVPGSKPLLAGASYLGSLAPGAQDASTPASPSGPGFRAAAGAGFRATRSSDGATRQYAEAGFSLPVLRTASPEPLKSIFVPCSPSAAPASPLAGVPGGHTSPHSTGAPGRIPRPRSPSITGATIPAAAGLLAKLGFSVSTLAVPSPTLLSAVPTSPRLQGMTQNLTAAQVRARNLPAVAAAAAVSAASPFATASGVAATGATGATGAATAGSLGARLSGAGASLGAMRSGTSRSASTGGYSDSGGAGGAFSSQLLASRDVSAAGCASPRITASGRPPFAPSPNPSPPQVVASSSSFTSGSAFGTGRAALNPTGLNPNPGPGASNPPTAASRTDRMVILRVGPAPTMQRLFHTFTQHLYLLLLDYGAMEPLQVSVNSSGSSFYGLGGHRWDA